MNNVSSPASYSVVLLGFDPSTPIIDGMNDMERLQQTFKITQAQARNFIQSAPVIVKRNATEKQARSYQKRLKNIGALVEIQPPLPAFFGANPKPPTPEVAFGSPSEPVPNSLPDFGGALGSGGGFPSFGADQNVADFLKPAPPASPLGAPAPNPFNFSVLPTGQDDKPSEFIPPHRRSQSLPQIGSISNAFGTPAPAATDDSSWVHDKSPALQTAEAQSSSANWFQPTRSYANESLESYLGTGQGEPNALSSGAESPVECPRCGRAQLLSEGDCAACGFNLANYYNPRNSMTIEFDVEKLRAGAAQQSAGDLLAGTLSSINVPSNQDPAVKQTFSNLLVYNELAAGKDPISALQGAMDAQAKQEANSRASLDLKAIAADIPSSTGFGNSGEHEAIPRPTLSSDDDGEFDPFTTSLGPSGGFKTIPRSGSKPSTPSPKVFPHEEGASTLSSTSNSERPPLAPAVRTTTRPNNNPVSQAPPDFWSGVTAAFTTPLKGSGLFWMLTIAGLLFTSTAASLAFLCLALPVQIFALVLFFGFIGVYFSKNAQLGLDGDEDGPDAQVLSMLVQEPSTVAIPGLALSVLATILFLIPSFLIAKVAVPSQDAPPPIVQPLSEDDLYYDSNGQLLDIDTVSTDTVSAWTIDSTLVTINTQTKTVTTQADAPKEAEFDLNALLLIFGALLLPYLYWPMALTVSALSNSTLNMFNPILVLKGIIKAPVPYLFVVFLGFAIPTAIFTGLAFSLEAMNSAILLAVSVCISFMAIAYTAGVQGYLMGVLVGSRRDDFAEFL